MPHLRLTRVIPRFAFAAILSLVAVAGLACGGSADPSSSSERPPQSPADFSTRAVNQCLVKGNTTGVFYGVNLDWSNDSIESYSGRLGRTPAVFVLFGAFPLSSEDQENIRSAATALAQHGSSLMLTLEPNSGLASVSPQSAQELASYLATLNQQGVAVFLRFAHEMNGSWYPWSQEPVEYVRAFRQVATAVHATADGTAMVWAPNYGGGYPFSGGKYAAVPGSEAYSLLDTNHDGAVSMLDDPYAPYYPGDDAVDWVGMSLYHWGSAYPWGENELPEPGKFSRQLTGAYYGANGDERSLPDFYAAYGVARRKPVAITETAAFFAPGREGDTGDLIKQQWWEQVFLPDLPKDFPQIKMVNWFEWSKFETEVQATVDWTVTRGPELLAQYQRALPGYLRFAGQC